MPDRVTSYGTDDGTAVMWLRFVSAAEGKFDEGELFCAQLVQNTPCADANVCEGFDPANKNHVEGTAAMFHASVSWLSMGKAKASEIKEALTNFNKTGAPIKFSDMFDIPPLTNASDPYYGKIDDGKVVTSGFNTTNAALDPKATPPGAGFPCATGFKAISTGGKPTECLKIKSSRTKWASRLETRRYAAMLGCNTEMEKWESSALDPIGRVMYTSISSASNMMAAKAPSGNGKPQDAVRIPKTNSCGCVMEVGFADETWKASYIKSHLCGSSSKIEAACNITSKDGLTALAEKLVENKDYGKKGKPGDKTFACDDFLFNQCNKSAIANPDGLTFMTELNQLVIYEDTKPGHRNDAVWVQNAWDGKITRIFTTPLGAEATGAQWYPNLGPGIKQDGPYSYLGVVVQHPYDEDDGGGKTDGKMPNNDKAAMRGYVGVIGPLKKVDVYVSEASSFSVSMIVSFVSVLFVSLFVF